MNTLVDNTGKIQYFGHKTRHWDIVQNTRQVYADLYAS